MLEGFAPDSVALLDELLERVIRDYILKGFSVLCSCRGGVGRAGTVALCFLLKFGLLGDISKMSTISTVTQAIEVIRRRRR